MNLPSYKNYKNHDVEWIGKVPAHWQMVRLKNVVSSIGSGGTPDTGTDSFWSDDETATPWIAIGDMSEQDYVHSSQKKLSPEGLISKRLTVWPKGTLLFSMYASLGHVAELQLPAAINQAILAITPNELIDRRYLKRWLQFCKPHLQQLSNSSTQENLNAEKVRNLAVLLPSREEQRAISVFLDHETGRIDALVAQHNRLIALLKEKRRSVISHAVTSGLDATVPKKNSGVGFLGRIPEHWEIRKLSNLAEKITNGYVGPTRGILVQEGVRYLQSLHIKGNQIQFDVEYYVTSEWSLAHDKSILKSGDVLVVQTGDIGQAAEVTDEFAGCNCHALIIVSPVGSVLRGDWLSWVLNSEFGYHSLRSIQTGALHPHLNCGDVKDIFIPLPPISEQVEIVATLKSDLASIDNLINDASSAVELLKEHRNALVSAVVTGRIDVRGLIDLDAAEKASEAA